jgi:hypothetical protein
LGDTYCVRCDKDLPSRSLDKHSYVIVQSTVDPGHGKGEDDDHGGHRCPCTVCPCRSPDGIPREILRSGTCRNAPADEWRNPEDGVKLVDVGDSKSANYPDSGTDDNGSCLQRASSVGGRIQH